MRNKIDLSRMALFVFSCLFVASCGDANNFSALEDRCLALVVQSEEYISGLPDSLETKVASKAGLERELSLISENSEVFSKQLFDCQASLLSIKENDGAVRKEVLSAHKKIMSIISVVDVYEKKLATSNEDLSGLLDRVIKNLQFVDRT